MPRRPAGLTLFAIINFVLGGAALQSLIVTLLFPGQYPQYSIDPTPFKIATLSLTGILLLVSGYGFLKLHYKAGFITGCVFCILSLVHILAIEGLANTTIPKLIYPLILLISLNVKYKLYFTGEAEMPNKYEI
ncbi:MAG: hypothetical protein GKR89_36585 [Candidatus Latescibacteria bacterium]|nr:hypothetical protein [Candidatus Latescibacterota bacterium]